MVLGLARLIIGLHGVPSWQSVWWPRRVRPLRPGPKLKAASANQKAEAAFCEPLRLIEKPKRPFLPASARYKAEAAWKKPFRPYH